MGSWGLNEFFFNFNFLIKRNWLLVSPLRLKNEDSNSSAYRSRLKIIKIWSNLKLFFCPFIALVTYTGGTIIFNDGVWLTCCIYFKSKNLLLLFSTGFWIVPYSMYRFQFNMQVQWAIDYIICYVDACTVQTIEGVIWVLQTRFNRKILWINEEHSLCQINQSMQPVLEDNFFFQILTYSISIVNCRLLRNSLYS